jgi:predicted Ser/Thr protein kinase
VIRNPSELQRVTEEFVDAASAFLQGRGSCASFAVDKGRKASREALLGHIRGLERQLGLEGCDYNNENFRPYYEKVIKEMTS